jgi:hypothetical protein
MYRKSRVTTHTLTMNVVQCNNRPQSIWSKTWIQYSAEALFVTPVATRSTLRPILSPVWWVSGIHSMEAEKEDHETDHSPPFITEVKNAWSYTPTLLHEAMGKQLLSDRLLFAVLRTLAHWKYNLENCNFAERIFLFLKFITPTHLILPSLSFLISSCKYGNMKR